MPIAFHAATILVPLVAAIWVSVQRRRKDAELRLVLMRQLARMRAKWRRSQMNRDRERAALDAFHAEDRSEEERR